MIAWQIILILAMPVVSSIMGGLAGEWYHQWSTARQVCISIRLLRKMQRENDYSPLPDLIEE